MVAQLVAVIGQAFGSVMKGFEVGSIAGLIQDIAGGLKQVNTFTSQIFKLIGLILNPIGNVIIGALMPILLILKPIAIAVNKIMLPFLRLGLEAMRMGGQKIVEGDLVEGFKFITAGALILMDGLTAAVMTFAGQLISTVIELFSSMLLTTIGIVFGISEQKIQDIRNVITSLVGVPFALATELISKHAAMIAKTAGMELGTFEQDAKTAIREVFYGGENNFKDILDKNMSAFTEGMETRVKETVTEEGGFTKNMIMFAQQFGDKGSERVGKIFDDIQRAAQNKFGGAKVTITQ